MAAITRVENRAVWLLVVPAMAAICLLLIVGTHDVELQTWKSPLFWAGVVAWGALVLRFRRASLSSTGRTGR